MGATMNEATTYPEDVRSKSAHVLAILILLQGIAAAGGLGYLVVVDGYDPMGGLSLFFLAVALVSIVGAILEWMRARVAESVCVFALLIGFGLVLAAVLAGVWYIVPFVALTTIAAIFGLVDRFAVRDETRHMPRH